MMRRLWKVTFTRGEPDRTFAVSPRLSVSRWHASRIMRAQVELPEACERRPPRPSLAASVKAADHVRPPSEPPMVRRPLLSPRSWFGRRKKLHSWAARLRESNVRTGCSPLPTRILRCEVQTFLIWHTGCFRCGTMDVAKSFLRGGGGDSRGFRCPLWHPWHGAPIDLINCIAYWQPQWADDDGWRRNRRIGSCARSEVWGNGGAAREDCNDRTVESESRGTSCAPFSDLQGPSVPVRRCNLQPS